MAQNSARQAAQGRTQASGQDAAQPAAQPQAGPYFLGIDVGTGSARAGLFDARGDLLARARHEIAIWHADGGRVEQSSADIWDAVCRASRAALAQAGIAAAAVAGIGFDATCSLVVVGADGQGLPVGPSGDARRDVIVWMDHRATEQARQINATGADVLRYVGGVISPEMQMPKLLWLARNLPRTFAQAAHFFDLTDFLTWRASGALARSACTVTCKWTYLGHESRWDADFLRQIGLGTLADEGFARIGTTIAAPGQRIGSLTAEAARDLGLVAGIAVAAGLIDAHAGGVGTVGASGGAVHGAEGAAADGSGVDGSGVDGSCIDGAAGGQGGPALTRMGYVFGTSACTMSSTREPAFVAGVWGPYYAAMVPGLWLNEGGQSAAGAAIARLLAMHPHAAQATKAARDADQGLPDWLAAQVAARGGAAALPGLVGGLHVVPEFLGNRAPHADPDARALIAGLGMEDGADSLIAQYLAGLCGLGYGLRQILAAQAAQGVQTGLIVVSGGAASQPLVRQVLADACGTAVAATTSPEPVMLGAAMLGAVAAGAVPDLTQAMARMSRLGDLFRPDPALAGWHDRRFAAFGLLQQAGRAIRDIEKGDAS